MTAEKLAQSADPLAAKTAKELSLQDVGYDVSNGVATVTIRRPGAYNSYSTSTLAELVEAITNASRDDAVGVIVLTGEGDRAFCTGGDVKEYSERYVRRPREYYKYMGLFRDVVEALLDAGKPTIARVNGMAVGGGNELHLACDLSIAAEHAWFGQVGVGVGSVAAGGATQWLPLAVGDRRARAMLLLNERIPARKALDWGLTYEVVQTVTKDGRPLAAPATPEEVQKAQKGEGGYGVDLAPLDKAVRATADRLLAMFPECLRYTREQTNFWKSLAWHNTIGHGREWLTLHFATLEPYEGMTAFKEKRRPRVADIRRRMAEDGPSETVHGSPMKACPHCGATGLPEEFRHCGMCGGQLS